MGSIEPIKPYDLTKWACPICNGLHDIDKYGWVDSCIGYYDLINIEYQQNKWVKNSGSKT